MADHFLANLGRMLLGNKAQMIAGDAAGFKLTSDEVPPLLIIHGNRTLCRGYYQQGFSQLLGLGFVLVNRFSQYAVEVIMAGEHGVKLILPANHFFVDSLKRLAHAVE